MTTPAPKVAICIACAPNQVPAWWTMVMRDLIQEERHGFVEVESINAVSTAVVDNNKNRILSTLKRRGNLTDVNRNAALEGALEGKAEWLAWLDDDTEPPAFWIRDLLALKRPFVAGLYFLGGPPFNPIAYKRSDNGMYYPFWNYPKGTLTEVDSVGMGCTLIHRDVYRKIRDEHVVFSRPTGSLAVVPRRMVKNIRPKAEGETYVKDGYLHMPVEEADLEDPMDKRSFPYYAMEFMRTEDHHFCELAAEVGYKPWLDTNIVCPNHFKNKGVTIRDYSNSLKEHVQEMLDPTIGLEGA